MADERAGGRSAERRAGRENRPLLRGRWLEWIILLGITMGIAFFGMWTMMPVSREQHAITVEIPRDWGVRRIAARLRECGLIKSETTFILSARVLGDWRHLKAGEYELSPSMTPIEILDKVARGDVKAYWVTIPEGSTNADIARIFHRMRLIDETSFLSFSRLDGLNLGKDYGVTRRNLEGYLFPDTYRVPKEISERQLLRQMLRTFHQQVLLGLRKEIAGRTNGLDMDQTIILASLVEREARKPGERARIAGVLVNRLRANMRLECDATVQYALGKTKARLLYKDLAIDSPYNTYKYPGLPPGPICNPGVESIRAALRPEKNEYFFYVADGKTGGHVFTRSYDEHQAAIRRIRGG